MRSLFMRMTSLKFSTKPASGCLKAASDTILGELLKRGNIVLANFCPELDKKETAHPDVESEWAVRALLFAERWPLARQRPPTGFTAPVERASDRYPPDLIEAYLDAAIGGYSEPVGLAVNEAAGNAREFTGQRRRDLWRCPGFCVAGDVHECEAGSTVAHRRGAI